MTAYRLTCDLAFPNGHGTTGYARIEAPDLGSALAVGGYFAEHRFARALGRECALAKHIPAKCTATVRFDIQPIEGA